MVILYGSFILVQRAKLFLAMPLMTHVLLDIKIIPARAFYNHPNIVEVVCHDRVEKIERLVFCQCQSLRRVIMRGVKNVELRAFSWCRALEEVECDKLEIIGEYAFYDCSSLRNINLQSARIVREGAFCDCKALTEAKFGSKLERFDEATFSGCISLERITIPLKDGIITNDDIFLGCVSLKHVDLVEGALLHETIVALQLEEWRNDMSEDITSIQQILPDTDAGGVGDEYEYVAGEKALVVRRWIRSVLDKILHYQAEHERVLDDAAATLQLALPQDLVMNYVLPFLELPPHRFGVEDHEDAE